MYGINAREVEGRHGLGTLLQGDCFYEETRRRGIAVQALPIQA